MNNEELYKIKIKQELINKFDNIVKQKDIIESKLYILEKQELIINNTIHKIKNNTNNFINSEEIIDIIDKIDSNKQQLIEYINKKSNEEIYNDLKDIYLTEYQNYFKTYKIKEKAQKDYYKKLIYEEIVFDIDNSEENMHDTIFFIKTQDYKKALLKDLIKEQKDFNIDLFNSLYDTIRNKVINEYKQELEIEKANSKAQNQFNIPLGWKVCALTEIVNKMMKIK